MSIWAIIIPSASVSCECGSTKRTQQQQKQRVRSAFRACHCPLVFLHRQHNVLWRSELVSISIVWHRLDIIAQCPLAARRGKYKKNKYKYTKMCGRWVNKRRTRDHVTPSHCDVTQFLLIILLLLCSIAWREFLVRAVIAPPPGSCITLLTRQLYHIAMAMAACRWDLPSRLR